MSKVWGKCKVCRRKVLKGHLKKQRGKCKECYENKLTIDRHKPDKKAPTPALPLFPSQSIEGGLSIPADQNIVSKESNIDEETN